VRFPYTEFERKQEASKRLIGLFKLPSENLRWHHLQALHRNVIHVKRKFTGWNSSLLITKCTTSLASDATIARAHSRYKTKLLFLVFFVSMNASIRLISSLQYV
jgi:hypothetical protein